MDALFVPCVASIFTWIFLFHSFVAQVEKPSPQLGLYISDPAVASIIEWATSKGKVQEWHLHRFSVPVANAEYFNRTKSPIAECWVSSVEPQACGTLTMNVKAFFPEILGFNFFLGFAFRGCEDRQGDYNKLQIACDRHMNHDV